MTTEKPELRATPVPQEATREELKKIREQAEQDSGVKRDLEDPKYVTALNKAWAEHYGDSHPLSKKILDFEQDGDHQKAMDAVKAIQKQLWLKEDGVIGYKTIKAYNEMLERNGGNSLASGTDPNKENGFAIESNLQSIDALGKEEKQEKLKTHSEELARRAEGGEEGLTDINWKALQVTEENGEKVFIWSDEGENNGKYYDPESGEYETKEGRMARIEWTKKEKQGKLAELKAKIDGGQEQELKDLEGNALRVETIDGKKVVMGTGNDKAQMYYDLETGEYQTKEARAEKQEKKIEDGLKGKVEGQWAKVEGAEYMRIWDEVFKKSDKQIGYSQKGERGDSDFSESYEFVDKYEVAKVGAGGKIWEFEETTKEEVDIVKGKREKTLREQESYGDQKERAIVMERILDQTDRGGIDEKIGDMTIGRIGRIKDNNDLTPAQRRDLQEFGKQAESLGRPDMTIRQYTELVRDPIKAAQEFATTKKGKLPGWLGEYGVEYQKNDTGAVLAYREGSEVPKIVQNGREVDIQEYFGDRVLESLSLGGGKEIMFISNKDGKKEYALIEKQDSKIIATRKIKEDGSLENVSDTPLMAANTK